MKLMKKKKKGFTLIELIAVIAILAILAVVAVPRVIKYVDKSKKVAVQTEASTIYNAAEAAYNDGKLTTGNAVKDNNNNVTNFVKNTNEFDKLTIQQAVESLESQDLLSANTNLEKFGDFKNNDLSQLKGLINTKTDDIQVNSQGVLQSMPGAQSQNK